jgi:hypothetical protein
MKMAELPKDIPTGQIGFLIATNKEAKRSPLYLTLLCDYY